MLLLRLWTPSMVGTEMLNDIEMETVNYSYTGTGSYYIDGSIIND